MYSTLFQPNLLFEKGKTMKAKETIVQMLVQKAAQTIVRRESEGWPPDSLWSAFQPHRPEKSLTGLQNKKSVTT